MGEMTNRFIESFKFPLEDINKFSASEKRGGGRPDFWEMVFWWTRKPLIGARSVIAGALLPENFNTIEFKHLVRLSGDKTPHRENPKLDIFNSLKEYFSKVKLLDPFAGFGSIPLEAMRLNLGEVLAVELLPTAYIFLKAILEYPKQFGEQLIKGVEKWGKWIIDKLREDPDIKELYDENVAVYIGSWEIKCPHGDHYTPLVGNWWLARVSKKSNENEEEESEEEETKSRIFRRLAWMEPFISSNFIGIKVLDLNNSFNKKEIEAKVNSKQGIVEVSRKVYNVPTANIDAKREIAKCLVCNNMIDNNKGKKWYVKEALKDYNDNLERYLRGEITLENLKRSIARPKLLVKVKIVNGELKFEPTTSVDEEKLWKAAEKLKQLWGDSDIPIESIPPYGNIGGGLRFPIYAIKRWYQLFNPRQLLTLVKLVKLIRKVGKKVEEEKQREGWDKEKAFKYAEAITTYLAIALARYADYNALVTFWNYGGRLPAQVAHALSMRGIGMSWNWGEPIPFIEMSGTGTFKMNLNKIIYKALPYLVSAVSDISGRVRILLDDATSLDRLNDERFDLIVTDPPYRDDVAYAELSDFYYVWLKRALCDVREFYGITKLVQRFHKEVFFDELDNEIETQWKVFASREISENEGRIKYFGIKTDALDYFKYLLSESFKTMASRLKDDGLLITYYAHTSPDAWEALLEAGWLNAKMRITAAHAMATESTESVVARGKARLDMSIVAVWRKGVSGEKLIDEVYAKAVEDCSKDAYEYRKAGFEGVNLFVAVLGKVLSHFTQYERLIGFKTTSKSSVKDLVEKYIYPATTEAIARSYGATGARLSPESMFYLLAKVLVGRRARQIRRTLDRTTAIILSIGTRSDLEKLKNKNIIQQDKKEKEKHVLLEPRWGVKNPKDAIADVITIKSLNPNMPSIKTAIDILHLLEYYSLTLPKEGFRKKSDEIRSKEPQLFEEAIALARILASSLPTEDPEKELTKQVIDALGLVSPESLEFFMKR
jgi:putative DNA methylase